MRAQCERGTGGCSIRPPACLPARLLSFSLIISSCEAEPCLPSPCPCVPFFRSQRYRICKEHLKSPAMLVDGIPQRFCQQVRGHPWFTARAQRWNTMARS